MCHGLLRDLSGPDECGEWEVAKGELLGAGLVLGNDDIGAAGLSLDIAESCLLLSPDILTRSLMEC